MGEVAVNLSFPITHGVTRAQADQLGSWWEDRRGIIQPSEFFLGPDGKVIYDAYSSGPVGRMNPPDIVKMVGFVDKHGVVVRVRFPSKNSIMIHCEFA
ncbi:MAG: hypothetical protein VCE75_23085 [Alphaproteobacteria bacterium]